MCDPSTNAASSSSRFLGVMPAFSRLSNGLGAKLVTFYTGNAQRGIPSHQAIITVFDPATGTLQAVRKGTAGKNGTTKLYPCEV